MKSSRKFLGSVLVAVALVTVGCAGDDGTRGADGGDGTNGRDGVDGDDGMNGTNGTNGTDGTDGLDGTDGTDGTNGTDGLDGEDGDAGQDGIDGEDGLMGTPGASGLIDLRLLTGDYVVYDLVESGTSGVSGVVRFAKFQDGSTLVTIRVTGTEDGIHPAHIHDNSAVESGPAAVTLSSVDGFSGVSETVVTALNSGTAITYDELVVFDGYVNVHTSPMVGAPVAAGDIGGNVLTGTSEVYPLAQLSGSGIMGEATLEERENGFSLLTIELTGPLVSGTDHPAHIHAGMAGSGGAAIRTLNNIIGATGISRTDIRQNDAAAALTYADLIALDAYINVHTSPTVATPIADGNIGSNFP